MEKSKRISMATFKIIEIEPVIKRLESSFVKFDNLGHKHSE
jgi:hypothetical protein